MPYRPGIAQIRVETRVVPVDVIVTDAHGKPIRDLTRDDFTILDNGKPREIRVFAYNQPAVDSPAASASRALRWKPPANAFTNINGASVPAAHRTVFVLDGVNGWFDNFVLARESVLGLLDKAPADETFAVYAIANSQGLVILQDYTTDRAALRRSISGYTAPHMQPAPPGMERLAAPPPVAKTIPPPPDAPKRQNATQEQPLEREYALRNASQDVRTSLQALAEGLAMTPGRKSVFWVTQGFPPTELRGIVKQGWDKTFEALNEANVAVNVLDLNGLGGPPRRWGMGAILSMQEIAERTGGVAYFDRNDFDQVLAQGVEASRNVYNLGFYLDESEHDKNFHQLAVQVHRPGLELHYRTGYYANGEERLEAAQKKAPLESALLDPSISGAVGITAFLDSPSKAARKLRLRVNLDPSTLTIQRLGNVWSGKVDQLILQMNESGRQVAKVSDSHEFRFGEQARPKYELKGVLLDQTIQVAEGATRMAVIVRDVASGRTGSLIVPLDKLAGTAGPQ